MSSRRHLQPYFQTDTLSLGQDGTAAGSRNGDQPGTMLVVFATHKILTIQIVPFILYSTYDAQEMTTGAAGIVAESNVTLDRFHIGDQMRS